MLKELEKNFFEDLANESLLYKSEDENLQEFHEVVANETLNFDEISQTNEFSPYFENLTSTLLFCWMQKHNICKISS